MSTAVDQATLTVEEELEVIRQENGGTTSPWAVVEFARDPDTALHSRFEWDDSEAAERYRIWQARRIIKVYVKYEVPDPEASRSQPVLVRTMPSTPKPPRVISGMVSLMSDRYAGNGYRRIEDVMLDGEKRGELMGMAKRELRSIRDRYKTLTELAEVHAAIDKVLTE